MMAAAEPWALGEAFQALAPPECIGVVSKIMFYLRKDCCKPKPPHVTRPGTKTQLNAQPRT